MVRYLITFLTSHPDTPVPLPWQRYYDVETELVYYMNQETGVVALDLRNRVNLGHGLFHNSYVWNQLTGLISTHPMTCCFSYQYNQDHPFLFPASCCCGPLAYLIVPECSRYCPICGQCLNIVIG